MMYVMEILIVRDVYS